MNQRRYLNAALKGGILPRVSSDRASDAGEGVAPILDHVRVMVSLIEGRRVGLDEVVRMLAKKRRQHSMVRERRIDYILRYLSDRGS